MKKIILIPDSFKGTLSSSQVCAAMEEGIHRVFPTCETVTLPIADGGEGSVDCFLEAMGGEKRTVEVSGPFGEPVNGFYGVLPDQTAVIEMAACTGLPMVGDRKNPMKTTTYGVGQLILHAVHSGCKKIILGLGGSCTNDGGCGAAAACGVQFQSQNGDSFVPVGGTLKDIASIDCSQLDPAVKSAQIITMCDIDNPLYGPTGAAFVFAPQKGADSSMVEALDAGLHHLADRIKHCLGKEISLLPGAGAAGGMGGGMSAFFDSHLQMGIETILDCVNFDQQLEDTQLVLTGEGKMDGQSLRGKAVIGVARRAKAQNVPVIVIAGGIEDPVTNAYSEGVTAAFSINRLPLPFETAKAFSYKNVAVTTENIMRILSISNK
ncbi:MAG: glycerate kinase [Massiliimalia sp.]|jgi:glycerate kinase